MHGSIRRNDEGFSVAEIEGRLTADGGSEDGQTFPDSMVGLPVGARFTSRTAADGKNSGPEWDSRYTSSSSSTRRLSLALTSTASKPTASSKPRSSSLTSTCGHATNGPSGGAGAPTTRWAKACRWTLAPVEETKVDLHDGFILTVKPRWRSDWDIEQLTIGAGLSLALSSADPVPTARYVRDFEQMQDLIGLCWSGRVIPLPGAGRVNHSVEDAGTFFSQPFFDPHHGNLADLSTPFLRSTCPISVARRRLHAGSNCAGTTGEPHEVSARGYTSGRAPRRDCSTR
jgi:hypothetical protein